MQPAPPPCPMPPQDRRISPRQGLRLLRRKIRPLHNGRVSRGAHKAALGEGHRDSGLPVRLPDHMVVIPVFAARVKFGFNAPIRHIQGRD